MLEQPNAQTHLLPEAAARHERRLEAVRCSALLGPYTAAQPSNGKELLSVSGVALIPSWEQFLGRCSAPPPPLPGSHTRPFVLAMPFVLGVPCRGGPRVPLAPNVLAQ